MVRVWSNLLFTELARNVRRVIQFRFEGFR